MEANEAAKISRNLPSQDSLGVAGKTPPLNPHRSLFGRNIETQEIHFQALEWKALCGQWPPATPQTFD
jgi:hypothetical protein